MGIRRQLSKDAAGALARGARRIAPGTKKAWRGFKRRSGESLEAFRRRVGGSAPARAVSGATASISGRTSRDAAKKAGDFSRLIDAQRAEIGRLVRGGRAGSKRIAREKAKLRKLQSQHTQLTRATASAERTRNLQRNVAGLAGGAAVAVGGGVAVRKAAQRRGKGKGATPPPARPKAKPKPPTGGGQKSKPKKDSTADHFKKNPGQASGSTNLGPNAVMRKSKPWLYVTAEGKPNIVKGKLQRNSVGAAARRKAFKAGEQNWRSAGSSARRKKRQEAAGVNKRSSAQRPKADKLRKTRKTGKPKRGTNVRMGDGSRRPGQY